MSQLVEVVLPAALDAEVGSGRLLRLELPAGARVRDVLDLVATRLPRVERRIRDETGAVRQHVNLFWGEEDLRHLQGQDTPVTDGGCLVVLPAVSGG